MVFNTQTEMILCGIICCLVLMIIALYVAPKKESCTECKSESNEFLRKVIKDIHDNVAAENRAIGRKAMKQEVIDVLKEVEKVEWEQETIMVLGVLRDAIERYE